MDEDNDLDQFAMFIYTLWFRRNGLQVEDKPLQARSRLILCKPTQGHRSLPQSFKEIVFVGPLQFLLRLKSILMVLFLLGSKDLGFMYLEF